MARRRKTSVRTHSVRAKLPGGAAGSSENPEEVNPIIIEAGSRSRASIRKLRNGTGSLMREVAHLVGEVRASSVAPAGEILPVVIVYREKERRGGLPFGIPSPLSIFL